MIGSVAGIKELRNFAVIFVVKFDCIEWGVLNKFVVRFDWWVDPNFGFDPKYRIIANVLQS